MLARHLKNITTGLAALLISSASQAALVSTSYTDANGEPASSGPNAEYMNPTGAMTFAMSGGLDRKVRVELQDTSGKVIDSATSDLIGAADKITVDGNTYYGSRLTLSSPGEGDYVTVAKILDNKGNTVQANEYRWTLDRTGYTPAGRPSWSQWLRYGAPDGYWSLVTGRSNVSISVGISGSGAPPESAVVRATSQKTGAVGSYSGLAIVGDKISGNLPSGSSLWPDREARYDMDLAVTDEAGNITHERWETRFDYTADPFEVVGITYEGSNRAHPWSNINGLEEFAAYDPGMKVDTYNPRVLVKIKKSELYPYSKSGIFGTGYCGGRLCLHRSVKHESGSYAYIVSSRATLESHAPKKYKVKGADLADKNSYQDILIGAKDGLPVRPQWAFTQIKFADGDVTSRYTKRNISEDSRYVEFRGQLDRAYSYDLIAKAEQGGTTVIPAGTRDFKTTVNRYYNRWANYKVCTRTDTQVCELIETQVTTDKVRPKLNDWSFVDRDKGQYRLVIKEAFSNTYPGTWGLGKANVSARDDRGESYDLDRVDTSRKNGTYTVIFSLDSLPTGHFDFSANAVDKFGNTNSWELESRDYDGQAPTVSLRAYGQPLGEQPLKTLGDIVVKLADDKSTPSLSAVKLIGGPADEEVALAWSKIGSGRYALEYPIMFPSLENGDYELAVEAIDQTGNGSSASGSFTYQPLLISMADDSQGTVTIPAVDHAFKRGNGGDLIHTQPFKLNDGSTLRGIYDVYATVRADAAVPVKINGVLVKPGQTRSVVGDHDFSSTEGSLSIPVSAPDSEQTGTANVLVSTSAPGAGIVSTRVRIWKANVMLEAPGWTVNQAIDELEINAKADSSTDCQLTNNENRAKRASAIDDPVCFIEWDTMPPGSVPARDAPGLRGFAAIRGDQEIEYSVWIYDQEGSPYLLQQATKTLHVANPDGVISFAPDKDISEVYHAVEMLDFSIEQNDGPECRATISLEEAQRNVGSRRLTCLIEWTSLPSGLAQIGYRERPQVQGHVENGGTNELAWRVSVVTINNQSVVLNEQSVSIDAVAPPAPEIAIDKDNRIKPGMYAAPMNGGYLGDAKITAYNAPLDVSVSRDGSTVESATSPSGWGDKNVVQRRLKADQRGLWSQTPYRIDASYADLSDSTASKVFTVLAVPSRNIAPTIEADGDTVLNTEPLEVSVRMANPFKDNGYDPVTMGEWRVRIVSLHGRDLTPITDYQAMPMSGSKSFTLDLDDIDEKRLRLSAQAEVVSPVESYERTVLSNRPIYMTVLRGEPIDSTIEGRRISGEAPLTAVMNLKIDNRLDKAALGEVKWQVSADKQSWSPLENAARYKTRFMHRFERGNYFVRAIVANENSDAVFKTPTVLVSAYLLPAISLDGPENAFIGSTAHYQAQRDENDENGDPETPLVYQWSTDRGEAWVDGEPAFHISRAEEARMPIWVRARYETAPGDDDDAWSRDRTRISFRKVRPPRVRIVGPRLVETDKPRDFRAAVRAPYRNMDVDIEGEWTLPDGSQSADSRELTYTATEADLANERVDLVYTTWITGYKGKGAVDSDATSLRIWQYEWPAFEISTRQGSDYAPSDVIARLRSRGATRYRDLDEPEVDWSVPEGLTVNEESRLTSRVLNAAQAGEYALRATISDARGHTATVSKKLVFKPAPPYQFDIRYTASNRYDRAPMEIRVRPYISGGHPRDRIESYSYTLDGQPVESASRFGEMQIEQAGTHRIGITIATQMGNTASGDVELEAHENQKPTCELKSRSARTYWRFYARCEDPDGRMGGYKWFLNGERVGTSSYRITVRNDGEGAPTVKVIGEDDSGAQSDTAIWHGDP